MNKKLIIAIDGPSGSGKSTLSKLLARALNYTNIDTGAMYRSVALAASRAGIPPEDGAGLALMCDRLRIEFLRKDGGERVILDGEDVSEAIRTPEASMLASRYSAVPEVRRAMVGLQRKMGADGGVVLEGRDIGTVVFPDADVKFFLLASPEERGRRRYEELKAKGLPVDLQKTVAEVQARDEADSVREHAPLIQATDALAIDTTRMNIDEVLQEMVRVIRERETR
ncbi:MAG: (d)CMP kinase [Syntrophotaleaceae bacterium]